MKTIFKKILTLSIAILFSLSATSVLSGAKSTFNVLISLNSISGALGSVRNSSDSSQTLHVNLDGPKVQVWAKNAAGTVKSCVSNDPEHADAVKAITPNSYVFVTFIGGTCTSVSIYAGSLFEPKEP